jgi:hypothetical protein
MNTALLNNHGQPFSKKQKQSSRAMMRIKKMNTGVFDKNPMDPAQKANVALKKSNALKSLGGLFRKALLGNRRGG